MGGQLLELGTGCGIGTAWMASGLQVEEGAQLFTIDSDVTLTSAVASLFGDWPTINVMTGDWRDALARAPFHMIFVDVADAKSSGISDVVDALADYGPVLIDDLTPKERWPSDQHGKPDPIREEWLNHPLLDCDEIRVADDHAVILGMKSRIRVDGGA